MNYFHNKVFFFRFRPFIPPFIHFPLAVWTLEDLIASVGSIDRGAAIKALSTWVDHGVLKEDPENTFVLLEKVEEVLDGEGGRGLNRDVRALGSSLDSFSSYQFSRRSTSCKSVFPGNPFVDEQIERKRLTVFSYSVRCARKPANC